MISLIIQQNSETLKFWFLANQNWLIPLLITIVFSIVNVAFAILNFINSKEQRKSQEIGLKINLSQKRLDIYEKEKIVLENIIDQNSLTSFELSELCNA